VSSATSIHSPHHDLDDSGHRMNKSWRRPGRTLQIAQVKQVTRISASRAERDRKLDRHAAARFPEDVGDPRQICLVPVRRQGRYNSPLDMRTGCIADPDDVQIRRRILAARLGFPNEDPGATSSAQDPKYVLRWRSQRLQGGYWRIRDIIIRGAAFGPVGQLDANAYLFVMTCRTPFISGGRSNPVNS